VYAVLHDRLLGVLVKPLGARINKVDHTCTVSEDQGNGSSSSSSSSMTSERNLTR
jgi:hypothetical protein